METIGSFEAKTHWSGLLDKVMNSGKEITITKRGKPVAKLIPYCAWSDAMQAVIKLRAARKNSTLGGISWKELRDEGRK